MRQKKKMIAAMMAFVLMAGWIAGCDKGRATGKTEEAETEVGQEVIASGENNESRGEKQRDGNAPADPVEAMEISYGVPLSEIGEKIEYVYFRENRVKPEPEDYEELGRLPQEKETRVLIYLLEGNKILFLPTEKVNAVMKLEDSSCPAYFSKEEECYLFFKVESWWMEENAVPVTAPASSTITLCEVAEREGQLMYSREDVQFLGDIDVVFSVQSEKSLEDIQGSDNEYIRVVMDYLSGYISEAGYYGKYQLYINRLERVPCDYAGYSDVILDMAVVGPGIREYVFCVVYDHDDIEGVYSVYEKQYSHSPGVLSDYPERDREIIGHIVENYLDVITLTVESEKEVGRNSDDGIPKNRLTETVDISALSMEALVERISHVYSYAEWFGLNELEYQGGEIRRFYGKEVAMYYWHNDPGLLYFVPLDKANHFIIDKEGNKHPVYVDKDGDMEFFAIEGTTYQSNPGQLPTSLVNYAYIPLDYGDGLVWLGEEKIPLKPLERMDLEPIIEDDFTRGLKKEIGELLTQAKKTGTYDVYLGEYSISDSNKICISAAVVGNEEVWYFRFLMVRYGKDDYHFWPIGFGLNGNLEECEKNSHRMNAVCIERLIKLERYHQTIQVGEVWEGIL